MWNDISVLHEQHNMKKAEDIIQSFQRKVIDRKKTGQSQNVSITDQTDPKC